MNGAEAKDYNYFDLRQPRTHQIGKTLFAEGHPAEWEKLEPRIGQLIAQDPVLKDPPELLYDIIVAEVITAMEIQVAADDRLTCYP